MVIALNHLIVPTRDKHESAAFLAHILGVPVSEQWGPFAPVEVGGVSFEFADSDEPHPYHCAFLCTEAEFDAALARIRSVGTPYWADPYQEQPGEINHLYGGRGVYFADPSGHQWELLTQPYGDAALFPRPQRARQAT